MTISSTNTRMDYEGSGAADTYSYTYKIFADSHLRITQRDTDDVETLLVLDTDYTVTGAGDTGGGSITLTAGNLPSDYILTILRVVPITQETDVRNQGDFFPDIHEDEFGKLLQSKVPGLFCGSGLLDMAKDLPQCLYGMQPADPVIVDYQAPWSLIE